MSYGTAKNVCIFQGRLVRDPAVSSVQMGTNQNGQPNMVDKALFTIAVDRNLSSAQRQKVQAGDQSVKTSDFIPLSATGPTAKYVGNYFMKGKACLVKCHYEEYTTTDKQTGEKKYGHTFAVDDIDFITSDAKSLQQNNGGNQQYNNNGGGYQQQPQQQQNYQQMRPSPQQAQNNVNANFSMFAQEEQPF